MGSITLHKPLASIAGEVLMPGSKSISNRVLMIRALSQLPFSINNLSDSDDTSYLQTALHAIESANSTLIDIGHAGTDMRFLTAYLSIREGYYELTGSERMQQRPMKELVEVLKNLGADILYKHQEGFPPLLINGKGLKGGKAVIKGNVSSQFISALLLVAPYFESGLELTIQNDVVSKPYVELTIGIMRGFGAQVSWKEDCITVMPVPYNYAKTTYHVESDWSAASYYYGLVALSPVNTRLILKGLFKDSLQADAVCSTIYKGFGIETQFNQQEVVISKTANGMVSPFEYDFVNCPDIAQTLACTCLGLQIPFYMTGLQTLKLKETDRILAIQEEFKKMNVEVQVSDAAIHYKGDPYRLSHRILAISTYNDHRMAMSFAQLAVLMDEVEIEDAEVVSKSYPLFWQDLKQIGIHSEP